MDGGAAETERRPFHMHLFNAQLVVNLEGANQDMNGVRNWDEN